MTSFAKRFTKTDIKKGPLAGATLVVAPFPSPGVVSVAGSVAGGIRTADALGLPREVALSHAAMLMEGTRKKKKRDIQQLLDSLGAELSFGTSTDRLNFSARVPAANVSKLLTLVAEILSEPSFPSAELAVYKKRMLAQFALQAEDPRTQASILLSRILYPKGHVNFLETTEESKRAVSSITPAQLRAYHEKTVGAATLIVSAAGDLTAQQFQKEIEKHFARLPKNKRNSEFRTRISENSSSDIQDPSSVSRGCETRHIAGKASIDYMAGIRLGINEDHPDYPAVLLGLRVLGNPGGFTGRLMQNVREKEGLTYGTYAYLSGTDAGADGYAVAWATFAPQLFTRGRTAVLGEIEKLLHAGVQENEVRKHAELFAARSEVRMNDSSAFAHAAHETLVDGRPLSYLDEFPERIRKLSAKEVNSALKKYLKLGLMSETAAGPVEKNALKGN